MNINSKEVSGLLRLTLLTCFCVLSINPCFADRIKSFDSQLKLNRDGTINVVETLRMDFGTSKKHGIFRFIPVTYERGAGMYSIAVNLKDIKDENGHPYQFSTANHGREILVKIGDPDVTVSGVKTYKISYDVKRAINYFNDKAEFYWNVTGNESKFPTDSVSAHLILPDGISSKDVKVESFVGAYGSRKHAAVAHGSNDITYKAKGLLGGEGLTVVVGLPEGAIPQPSQLAQVRDTLVDWYQAVLIPVGWSILLYLYWLFQGKDKATYAVGVEFTPPKDLTPAEVGTLIDEKCDMPDVLSTLIDLAARGYLKIRQLPYKGILMLSNKDYEFKKTIPPAGSLPLKLHESLFMDALFGYVSNTVYLSSLQGKFQPHIELIKRSIWSQLLHASYFTRHPDDDRRWFMNVGVLLLFLAFAAPVMLRNEGSAIGLGLSISSVLTFLTAGAMPCRTERGSKVLSECLSFKRFVQKAEKDRIRVLASEDPTIFGRLLPYAMVLGCADQWAEKFKDLLTVPPDWYESSQAQANGFDALRYLDDLGHGMSVIQNGFMQPPLVSHYSSGDGSGGWGGFGGDGGSAGGGSSGFDGGFSGGGFGGGGVDSW